MPEHIRVRGALSLYVAAAPLHPHPSDTLAVQELHERVQSGGVQVKVTLSSKTLNPKPHGVLTLWPHTPHGPLTQ